MSNPKLEIAVCINTLNEQIHILNLIVNLQHYLRKLKIDRMDPAINNIDKCHAFARKTILEYKKLLPLKKKSKRR